MLFEAVFFSDQLVPAILLLRAVDQLDGDRFGGGLSKDFGDEVLRFRDAFYLARTNHGAEFGSLGADCSAKSQIRFICNTLCNDPPEPWPNMFHRKPDPLPG